MRRYLGQQGQETTPPPNTSPLGALAKGKENKNIKKVSITGETPKPGPKHGDAGVGGLVWDSVKGAWVKKEVLSTIKNKDKVVIDTGPSKK
jgi:hypothetical protein